MARTNSSSLPRELFLSHSSRNRPFVTKLIRKLSDHGIPVWHSGTKLIGGQQWHDEIGRALARCDWFAVVLSPDAVSSIWVKRETFYALNDPRYEGRIIPILFRPCDPLNLSWTLPAMQRVDFTKNFDDGCRELLRIWGLDYSPD